MTSLKLVIVFYSWFWGNKMEIAALSQKLLITASRYLSQKTLQSLFIT